MSTNMFLKIGDIKGESADEKHADWIEILSWGSSWEQPVTALKASTGASLEKCKHEPITIAKTMDIATPGILKAMWLGAVIPQATIECFRAAGENVPIKYLTIIMDDVMLNTYSIGGGEGDIPQEEIAMSCGVVTYEYIPMDKVTGKAGGMLGAKADLIKNLVE